MSNTSCYRYVLELPPSTINDLLVAALSEDEGAGIGATVSWDDVPIGDLTADIEIRPADPETHPSSLELTTTELGVLLKLAMRAEISIDEFPDLDTTVYYLAFDLRGLLEKTAEDPPTLVMRFPGVDAASLNLVISGDGIVLTPALVEPRVHQMYDEHPELAHNVQTNVALPVLGECMITADIYDDEPGSPGFRGAITVEIPGATTLVLKLPGHFRVQGISTTHLNTDMGVDVEVPIEQDLVAGKLVIKLQSVSSGDVTVVFATPHANPLINNAMIAGLQARIASTFNTFSNLEQDIPSEAAIRTLAEGRLVELATTLAIPLITTKAPATPEEFDMRTFVPTTLGGQVLALQLDPLADGTPCDPPDVFALASGFSLAIAPQEVNRLVRPYIDDSLGSREIQGYDVDVTSMNVALEDAGEHSQDRGHLWLEGSADVAVDCWPDPTVAFWGPIFLIPQVELDGRVVFQAEAGVFDADEPCCGDVDPSELAALVEGHSSTPVALPKDFTGVGSIQPSVDEAVISRGGIVVHGTFTIVTNTQATAARRRRMAFWAGERAGS